MIQLSVFSISTLAFPLLLASPSALAKDDHEHRHHEAHVHGAATLQMAFDQAKGKIEFKAASAGILGFEHQPKTENEKRTLTAMISEFENGIKGMIKFDDNLACVFTKDKIAMLSESEHSDFIAEFTILCAKSPKDSRLVLDFTKLKKIKDLDVTILVDDLQKSVEIKRKAVTVDLK